MILERPAEVTSGRYGLFVSDLVSGEGLQLWCRGDDYAELEATGRSMMGRRAYVSGLYITVRRYEVLQR